MDDTDNRNGGNERTVHVTIPWDNLPKMPIVGVIGGFTPQWQQQAVGKRVAAAYFSAGRPLTDTETEAISYWWARSAAMQGYQVPVYFASTYYFMHKTRSVTNWRFPLYTPKNLDPQVFPNSRSALLKGRNALVAWRFVQVAAYYSVSRLATSIFFASWALSASTANIAKDERLKEWLDESMEMRKHRFKAGRPREVEAAAGSRPQFEMGTSGGGMAPDQNWRAQDQAQDQAQDRQSYSTTQQQSAWSRSSPPAPRPQVPPQYQPPAPAEYDAFGDDDASPVAPAARREQPSLPPPAPGSAWNRVRQGQVPRQDGSTQSGSWAKTRQTQEQNADQQSYSYSQDDAEKTYAQQQAQKEFDEMLERERQGKSEKSNRRW